MHENHISKNDVIKKICPICGNEKLEWRNPKGFYHTYQDCYQCKSVVGYKRFYNKQVWAAWELSEVKHKMAGIKKEVEKIELLIERGKRK